MIKTHILPILSDNYTFILEADNGDIAVLDPGEATPVITFLEKNNLIPRHIFLTHHHSDHIAGVQELLIKYPDCDIYGPASESDKIKFLTHSVTETSKISFGGEPIEIIETPGHTLGQINYYSPESKTLFSGDTLFVMGCGRVFEGTMEQMHTSLQKLAKLPDDTKVYCGHEYTLSNAKFSAAQEPENAKVTKRYEEIKTLRAQNLPTIPSTILQEKQTNLFLRAQSVEEFSRLRKAKDNA